MRSILIAFVIEFLICSSGGLAEDRLSGHHSKGFTENRAFDRSENTFSNGTGNSKSLGYDGAVSISPGDDLGTTLYELQTNATMPRLVDWHSVPIINFSWTAKYAVTPADRYIEWYAWDGSTGSWNSQTLNPPGSFAGYASLDASLGGLATIACNFNGAEGYLPRFYRDFTIGSGFFADNITMTLAQTGGLFFTWPRIETQISGLDTIMHVLSQDWDNGYLTYSRFVGQKLIGGIWDPHMRVDTTSTTGYIVTASRVSQKVAIVWAAPPGGYPGDPESKLRGNDASLGVDQRTNDIYYMVSGNMGSSWGPKINLTQYDSTVGGYLNHGDLSAMYDSNDRLHIVWNGRPVNPNGTSLGDWAAPDAYPAGPVYGGTRASLFHWDELNNVISVVSEAEWDQPYCYGHDWNEMNINKPMISECDGKFYIIWVQFNDVPLGIEDDCHDDAFSGGNGYSDANGEIYLSVSSDGGLNWGFRQNLTNSYTPGCTDGNCESDGWPSMAKYGVISAGLTFPGTNIVDPSGTYAGDYFLDVIYINDLSPGQYWEHSETTNPVKWFRLACVDPVPVPLFVINDLDAGPGSFRAAIESANSLPGENMIQFNSNYTINLAADLPPLTDDLTTILGANAIIDGSAKAVTGHGLEIQGSNIHIEGLTIRNFPGDGIAVTSGTGNTFTENLIYDNGGLGIDLNDDGVTPNDLGDGDSGPNDLLNSPKIDSVKLGTPGTFYIWGKGPANSIIEIYVARSAGVGGQQADPSGHGEAYTYVETDVCNGTGHFHDTIPGIFEVFSVLTATATDASGNTSEFSENFSLTPAPLIIFAQADDGTKSPNSALINLWVTDPNADYIGKDESDILYQTIYPAAYIEITSDSIIIPYPVVGEYIIEVIGTQADPPSGATYAMGIQIDGSVLCVMVDEESVPASGDPPDTIIYVVEEDWHYTNGDADRNDNINILDITYLISYLYKEGPAPDPEGAGDADCNLTVNILDITYLISYLYKEGPQPCEIP